MIQNNNFSTAKSLLDKIHKNGFAKYTPDKELGGILRPQQYEAILQILCATFILNKTYIALSAPTGCGKSIIAKVYTRIMNLINGDTSNIMTANRELQKQYGRDLKHDDMCKVIMGTANYRCSFFTHEEDEKKKFTPTSESPCHNTNDTFQRWWPFHELATTRTEPEIKTAHDDQDYLVLARAVYAEMAMEDLTEPVSKLDKKDNDECDYPIYRIKKACVEQGCCSYYHARMVAEEAPVVIRSLQHLLFYIMFNVGATYSREIGILNQRDIHIFDESHTIEGVFRGFLSVDFDDRSYSLSMMRGDIRDDASRAIDPIPFTFYFTDIKTSKGDIWSDSEKDLLAITLENEMATFLEKLVLPQAKLQNPGLKNAKEMVTAILTRKLYLDIEVLDSHIQSVFKWYTNIAIANQERRKYRLLKANNYACTKAYDISIASDSKKTKVSVFPIFLHKAKKFFGKKHNLFMSATPIPGKVLEKLFDIEGEVAYINIPSDFPHERSPIYFAPVETITEPRAKELGSKYIENKEEIGAKDRPPSEYGWLYLDKILSKSILEIASKFDTVSGVVPCNSYKRVLGLQKFLGKDPRFIFVTEGKESRLKVAEFRDRSANREFPILVSASISEGHSFDDSISRFQIIPKMPFPTIDSAMSTLMEAYGKHYYASKTVSTIQQMCGRSMRSKEDYCVTILLDQKFEILKNNLTYRENCTQHFLDCIRWDGDWQNYQIPEC